MNKINLNLMDFLRQWIAVGVISFLVSACGGGGGGGAISTQGQSNSGSDVLDANPISPVSTVGLGVSSIISTAPDQAVAVAQLPDKSSLLLFRVGMLPSQLKLIRLSSEGVVLESQIVASAQSHGNIGYSDLFDPSMKIDGDNVYIAWLHVIPSHTNSESYRQLNVRTYKVSSGLGADQVLNVNIYGSVLSYKMEASSDGNAWVAWAEVNPTNPVESFRGPSSIYAESIQGDGTLSMLDEISSQDPDVSSVTLSASKNGHVALVWPIKTGAYQVALRSAIRSADGVWSAPVTVYQSTEADCYYGFSITDLQIAIDGSGNAMAIWSLGSWACQTGGVAYSYLDGQFGWSNVEVISNSGLQPRLAINTNGQGVLTWIDVVNNRYAVIAARFDRDGGSEPEVVGRRDFPYGDIYIYSQTTSMVAINEVGNIAVTWTQEKSVNGPSVINGRFFSKKSGWSLAKDISIAKDDEGVMQDAIWASPNGDFSLIWRQGDLTGGDGRSHSWLTRFDASLIE